MPKSIVQVASLLDQAHEALMIMARDAAGPENADKAKVEFYAKDGGAAFDLAELAADLRKNAIALGALINPL